MNFSLLLTVAWAIRKLNPYYFTPIMEENNFSSFVLLVLSALNCDSFKCQCVYLPEYQE